MIIKVIYKNAVPYWDKPIDGQALPWLIHLLLQNLEDANSTVLADLLDKELTEKKCMSVSAMD